MSKKLLRPGDMLSVFAPLKIHCSDAFWLIVDGVVDENAESRIFVNYAKRLGKDFLSEFVGSLIVAQRNAATSIDGHIYHSRKLLDNNYHVFCEQVGFPIIKELFMWKYSRAWVNVNFSLCQIANCLLSLQKSSVKDVEACDYAASKIDAFRKYVIAVAELPRVDARFRYSSGIEQELLEELCERENPLVGWLDGRRIAREEFEEATPEMGLVRAFCHAHSAMAEKGAT